MSKNAPITGNSLGAEAKAALGVFIDLMQQARADAMTIDELSRCGSHQNPFENAAKAYSAQIEEQLRYFRDRWGFGYTDDEFGGLYVPRPSGHCKKLLIVPAEFAGPEDIFSKWVAEAKFSVIKYTDKSLNDFVPNDRRRSGHYALLHSGRQEADVEFQNRSWEQNLADRKETMRLIEVLLWEDVFFRGTKEHIDPNTVTLTGSRGAGGGVAGVGWVRGSGGLCVGWHYPRSAGPDLRARAVSL